MDELALLGDVNFDGEAFLVFGAPGLAYLLPG